jgi:hypothetical protein
VVTCRPQLAWRSDSAEIAGHVRATTLIEVAAPGAPGGGDHWWLAEAPDGCVWVIGEPFPADACYRNGQRLGDARAAGEA